MADLWRQQDELDKISLLKQENIIRLQKLRSNMLDKVESKFSDFMNDLEDLRAESPKEALKLYLNLLEYVVPKQQRQVDESGNDVKPAIVGFQIVLPDNAPPTTSSVTATITEIQPASKTPEFGL